MSTTEKECLHCKQLFNANIKELNRGYGKFCSRACSAKGHTRKEKLPNTNCALCNSQFYSAPSKSSRSKSGLRFCSRKCKDTAQRIGGVKGIQPSHYGTSNPGDYRSFAFRELENKCCKCSYNKHPEILEVHHKDRGRMNSSITNLEILCPTCHMEEHFLSKDGKWRLRSTKED